MIFDIAELEERIGYSFKDKMLLRRCFTHSSYAHEHNEEDNELLEFFGDAIIKFIDSEFLFKNGIGDEGKLTEKRKNIESNTAILKTVKRLGLDEFVLVGRGQKISSHHDEKLYSSAYEALVAGIYLDGGILKAKKFVLDTIIADFSAKEKEGKTKKTSDAKSAFQEYVQKRKIGSISYETLDKSGPDHNPTFRVVALLNGMVIAEGKGASKKSAEAEAAKFALILLKQTEQGGK